MGRSDTRERSVNSATHQYTNPADVPIIIIVIKYSSFRITDKVPSGVDFLPRRARAAPKITSI